MGPRGHAQQVILQSPWVLYEYSYRARPAPQGIAFVQRAAPSTCRMSSILYEYDSFFRAENGNACSKCFRVPYVARPTF